VCQRPLARCVSEPFGGLVLPTGGRNMKNRSFSGLAAILTALALAECPLDPALAEERIRMTCPSPAEEAVKTLTRSLETACQNRDLIGFLSHFTPRRAAQIRRPMQDLFICHDVTMEVHDTLILSESESAIIFGVRYSWHETAAPKQLIASRVTAKRIGESWMLDAEEILSRRASSIGSNSSMAPVADALGGRIPLEGKPDWVPPGIEWVPGGCADGRCGL
jgi:hypothetical protein